MAFRTQHCLLAGDLSQVHSLSRLQKESCVLHRAGVKTEKETGLLESRCLHIPNHMEMGWCRQENKLVAAITFLLRNLVPGGRAWLLTLTYLPFPMNTVFFFSFLCDWRLNNVTT